MSKSIINFFQIFRIQKQIFSNLGNLQGPKIVNVNVVPDLGQIGHHLTRSMPDLCHIYAISWVVVLQHVFAIENLI